MRLDKVIESIKMKIDEGILTSSREDSEESDDEEEKGSKKLKWKNNPMRMKSNSRKMKN